MAVRARDSILGVFGDPDTVVGAVEGLRNAGFTGSDVKVLSDTPYPEGAFGETPERHRLYVFPFMGAICGFSVALLLTVATQLAWPMVTDGKPIIAVPPMVNIMYEGTMLGAILFTVIGIIFESRLPDFGPTPYDPRISQGYLGLLVSGPTSRIDEAARALQSAGAIEVVTTDGARARA